MSGMRITLAALWLCGCSLLNAPETRDLCAEHGAACDELAQCKVAGEVFRCICPRGYRDVHGNGTLCRDRDECADGSARCDPLARCDNSEGSYVCHCPEGYLEENGGRKCSERGECLAGVHTCDADTQVCRELAGPGFSCECQPGFRAGEAGEAPCVDLDECAGALDDCVAPATCANNEGGFDCKCPPGFPPLDRNHCEVVDPCEPARQACLENTRCEALPLGEPICACLDGYERVDALRCKDVDECRELRPCEDGSRCTNLDGGFSCECAGYYTPGPDGACEDRRLEWSTSLDAHLLAQPLADSDGNLLLAGTFFYRIELCGRTFEAADMFDVFVVEYGPAPERECLWARAFGDTGVDELIAATIDPEGDPVLVVSFLGTLDFGNGVVADSSGQRARAIVKLDGASGGGRWAHTFFNVDPAPPQGVTYGAVTTSAAGDVLWAGALRGGALLESSAITDDGDRDALVVELDGESGAVQWSQVFGGPYSAIASGAAFTPRGDIVVTGLFQTTIELGDQSLQGRALVSDRWNGFAVGLHPDGRVRWRRLLDGIVEPLPDPSRASAVSAVAAGGDRVVIAGSYSGELRLPQPLHSAGKLDAFLIALDARSGDDAWVRSIGGPLDDTIDQVAYGDGELVAIGSFEDTILFEDTALSAQLRDVFALALDGDGEQRWVQRFGGRGVDRLGAVTKGPRGETYATGSFASPLDLGKNVLTSDRPAALFVLQLRR